jgi:hypothetical protein
LWNGIAACARRAKRSCERYPTPLPCFLEVLILHDFKSLSPEVLILQGFKSLFREVLILVGFKSRTISKIEKTAKFLEVLILNDLVSGVKLLIVLSLVQKTRWVGHVFHRVRGEDVRLLNTREGSTENTYVSTYIYEVFE